VIKDSDDYFRNLPPSDRRPKTLPPPPDTPDHLMTVETWGETPPPADPPPVRRGREALVVLYHGMTVAHCPRRACANVELITDDPLVFTREFYRPADGKSWPAMFHCSNCRYVGPLEWPDDYDKLTAELERRPVPETRNWYPAGHPFAVAAGVPTGQSVRDLKAEFAEHGDEF
jgi:hypothetical protein